MLIIISSSVTTFALEINYLKVSHHSCVVCSRESTDVFSFTYPEFSSSPLHLES